MTRAPTRAAPFPICVALAARHEWPPLRGLFRKLTISGLALGTVAAIIMLAIAHLVVPLEYGPRYPDSVPAVRVLYLTVPMVFTSLVAMSLVHTLHLEWMAIRAALFCIAANMLRCLRSDRG